MANDFSLDPLQIEEDILNQQYKNAIARSLRTPQAPAYDIGANALTIMDNLNARFDIPKLEKKRKDLSEKFEASLVDALRGQDPEIQALASHPATRTEGLALMKKRQQQRLDKEDLDNLIGLQGGRSSALPLTTGAGGGVPDERAGIPPLQVVTAMMMHSNESIRKRGEVIFKTYYEGQDPSKNVRLNPQGGYNVIPGSAEGQHQNLHLKELNDNTPIMVPLPGGGERQSTRGEEYRRSLGMPATGGAGPGAPSVQQPGSPPASGPIPPAIGPNSPSPPTGPGGPGLPPEAQQLIALIQNPQVPIQIKDQAAAMLSKMGVNFSGLSSDRNVQPQASMGPPSALPQTTGSMRERPVAGPRETVPPDKLSLFQKTREADIKQLEKAEEASGDISIIQNQLQELKNYGAQPSYSGLAFDVAKGINYIAPSISDPKLATSRGVESVIKTMAGPLAKQFGYNPSNIDLKTALDQLPSMADNPQARAEIIARLERGIAYQQESMPVIRQLVEQGMSLVEARATFDRMYRQRQEAAGNPTGAGSAQTSALPATVAARNAPTSDPTDPNHPGNRYDPVEAFGYYAGQLPKSIFSRAGGDAGLDVLKNKWEGGKQLLGFGDREGYQSEIARQNQREETDPQYFQARKFFDVANPTNMIPGGTLVKSTLAAGLSGALDPKASLGDQLTSGAISAVSNVVPAAVTSKLLPATRLAGDINVGGSGDDLLKAFPSFKPTSAQVSPRSPENAIYRSMGIDDAARLSQARSITKDLMSKAGIEGQELTGKSLTARAEAIEQSFNQLLSPKIKVKVGGLEQAQFLEAAKNYSKLEPAMAKSPTLAMIHRALSNDKPELIRASDLHRAWKEAKEVTGDFETTKAIRSVLESLITKAVPEGQKDVFGRLTSQWDLLQDLNRIYHAGGQGTGPASGALAPSKIEQYVSSGQVRHPAIDQTVELIKRFGVTDYRPARIGADSLLSPIADITKAVAGPVLRHAEVPAPVKQLPPVKFMIDLLRAGGMRGVAATDDLRE